MYDYLCILIVVLIIVLIFITLKFQKCYTKKCNGVWLKKNVLVSNFPNDFELIMTHFTPKLQERYNAMTLDGKTWDYGQDIIIDNCFLPDIHVDMKQAVTNILYAVEDIIKDTIGSSSISPYIVSVTKYSVEQGVNWHVDQNYITAIIPLNDTFTGGELLINNKSTISELKYYAKDVLIITGDIPHKVQPIKIGTRYVLCIFYELDRGQINKDCKHINVPDTFTGGTRRE